MGYRTAVAVLLTCGRAFGEPAPGSLALDAGGVFPLSDYADIADFGIGGFVRYERTTELGFTGRGGALTHVGTTGGDSLLIFPVLAGARLRLGAAGWSVGAEAGITVIRHVDRGVKDIGVNPAFAFGGGFQSKKLHLRLEFLVPDLREVEAAAGLMLTAGIDLIAL